ncbi:N-6 DNA methylase [Metabacillus herbersteinensis]|uniref:N-6 DNA methylase n=1 Tax=Metabacillus herbersteinensis TaxID=283816 RepID=A0ABV6GJK2_9BACI
MSHIGNKLRSGFFATPLRQGEFLTELLEVKGDCSFFDPTCGEGEILHHIVEKLRNENDKMIISSYGVELDKARASKASEALDHCINAPIESMVIVRGVLL